MDKGSKVLGVESMDAHMYTPGIKRVGGPAALGKPSKVARYTVTDLLPEDEQGQQKWRGNPAETFSDWTIEVQYEGPMPVTAAPAPAPEVAMSATATPGAKGGQPTSLISPEPFTPMAMGDATLDTPMAAEPETIEIQTQVNTYHVHRYFLAFGTRRGNYFTQLFKDRTSGAHSCKFELEPLAAKAFPDLLDFLYEPLSPLVIETETATALHHLAVKFEMAHLQHYAKEFIQKDLSLETLETYYQHAKIFADQVVLDKIVEFIGKNIGAISSTSNFVKTQTDAALWKSALDHVLVHPSRFDTDLHISKLISEFGVANKESLDAATFQELTSETKLRKVDPGVAFALCDLDDQFGAEAQEGGLSSLQQRCATALSETWKELDTREEQVNSRKATFLVDLLGKCLSEARAENERLATGGRPSTGPAAAHPRGAHGRASRVESSSGRPRATRHR